LGAEVLLRRTDLRRTDLRRTDLRRTDLRQLASDRDVVLLQELETPVFRDVCRIAALRTSNSSRAPARYASIVMHQVQSPSGHRGRSRSAQSPWDRVLRCQSPTGTRGMPTAGPRVSLGSSGRSLSGRCLNGAPLIRGNCPKRAPRISTLAR